MVLGICLVTMLGAGLEWAVLLCDLEGFTSVLSQVRLKPSMALPLEWPFEPVELKIDIDIVQAQ